MNDGALVIQHGGQVAQAPGGALSAAQIRDRVNLIQQVMQGVMKAKTHYDTIPGTDKPSLLKAGAEVLCTTFRIAVDPEVQDLSVSDEIRFRVRAVGRNQVTGEVIGVGIGECSSYEEKYKWRRAICDEEFEAFPEERRRIKFARGQGGKHYQNKQVRTEGADVANTVLKMAKKRALVDFTLTALAASDIFAQDLEDMSEEIREATAGAAKPEVSEPKAKEGTQTVNVEGGVNPTQIKLLRKKMQDPAEEDALCKHFGVEKIEQIPAAKINEALQFVEGK